MTNKEAAKDLRYLRGRSHVGHQKSLMMAILLLEKEARKEPQEVRKPCKCACKCAKPKSKPKGGKK